MDGGDGVLLYQENAGTVLPANGAHDAGSKTSWIAASFPRQRRWWWKQASSVCRVLPGSASWQSGALSAVWDWRLGAALRLASGYFPEPDVTVGVPLSKRHRLSSRGRCGRWGKPAAAGSPRETGETAGNGKGSRRLYQDAVKAFLASSAGLPYGICCIVRGPRRLDSRAC